MDIQDVARDVAEVPPDATTGRVARLMREEGVDHVTVVDDRHPVGVVTERDIVTRVTAEPDIDPGESTIQDVMTPDPVTLMADRSVLEGMARLRENAARRAVVVGEADRALVGILTMEDLQLFLAAEQQYLIEASTAMP